MDLFQLSGWMAVGLLVLGNLYTPLKWFRRAFPSWGGSALQRQLGLMQKSLLDWHCFGNVGVTVFSAAHTLFRALESPHADPFAWGSLAIMCWLSISGFVMRTRFFPSSSRKGARLLHAQYFLTILLVAILGIHIAIGRELE